MQKYFALNLFKIAQQYLCIFDMPLYSTPLPARVNNKHHRKYGVPYENKFQNNPLFFLLKLF